MMEKTTGQPTTAEAPLRLAQLFSSRFGSAPRIFRAPGRVNLIGEHTDYNDGFVLPAAIDLYTWTAITPRSGHTLRAYSENLGESCEIDLADTAPPPREHWSDYLHGVALMMEPIVGTRSVESSARSCTTPSRMPGPRAIIQVVRDAASPVRWC